MKYAQVIFKKNISCLRYRMIFPSEINIIGFGGYKTKYVLQKDVYFLGDYYKSVQHLLENYTSYASTNDGMEIIGKIKEINGKEFESSFTKFQIESKYEYKKWWINEKNKNRHYLGLPITTIYPIRNTLCDVYKLEDISQP